MITLADLATKLGELSASIKEHFNFKAQAEKNATDRDAAIAERDAANTAKATAEAALTAEQSAHALTKTALTEAQSALVTANDKLADPKGTAAKAVAEIAAEAGVEVGKIPAATGEKKTLTYAAFQALSHEQRNQFVREGGKIS